MALVPVVTVSAQKYRPFWVSVLVLDLNQNSGFVHTLTPENNSNQGSKARNPSNQSSFSPNYFYIFFQKAQDCPF